MRAKLESGVSHLYAACLKKIIIIGIANVLTDFTNVFWLYFNYLWNSLIYPFQ